MGSQKSTFGKIVKTALVSLGTGAVLFAVGKAAQLVSLKNNVKVDFGKFLKPDASKLHSILVPVSINITNPTDHRLSINNLNVSVGAQGAQPIIQGQPVNVVVEPGTTSTFILNLNTNGLKIAQVLSNGVFINTSYVVNGLPYREKPINVREHLVALIEGIPLLKNIALNKPTNGVQGLGSTIPAII